MVVARTGRIRGESPAFLGQPRRASDRTGFLDCVAGRLEGQIRTGSSLVVARLALGLGRGDRCGESAVSDDSHVLRFDYPLGRPARFAFVEADRTFRVVEASSGEKGPFRTLAKGRLAREASLTITLHDQGSAIGRISLADWSSQADTGLSPTAGWGVPVNAIEFSLSGELPSSPASIFLTLAGTSVGRGWDCVGHKPGTYCNRIRLEPVATVSRGKHPATIGPAE